MMTLKTFTELAERKGWDKIDTGTGTLQFFRPGKVGIRFEVTSGMVKHTVTGNDYVFSLYARGVFYPQDPLLDGALRAILNWDSVR